MIELFNIMFAVMALLTMLFLICFTFLMIISLIANIVKKIIELFQ